MEYVKGEPITRYCDGNRLSIEDRLSLFRQVCSGIQHAHSKGVIHRDLTPNNILVSVEDGSPTAKIIDFGLAKATDQRLTEKTLFTEQGVVLGTPEYMSPEQAGVGQLDVDTRSDVYTLGVVLYQLLVGSLPFARDELAGGYGTMCQTIREKDPPRPSTRVAQDKRDTAHVAKVRRTDLGTLRKRLRGDLDWIVMKCLEKDRTRRYETVASLADDLQRHLQHRPVEARPPSTGYLLRKLARRHRGQLAAAGLVLLALLAGLAGTTWYAMLFAGKVAEFDQLAGVVNLERALAAEKELYPAWPEKIEALQRWLDTDASRLLRMKPQIEAALQSLRGRTRPPAADQERDETAEAFLLDTQSDLLSRMTRFQTNEHRAVGDRLAWAQRIATLTLGHPKARASWEQARAAIARADGKTASALYALHAIDLQPQTGLVPIGMNPVTKLWEFYELRSAFEPRAGMDPGDLAIPQHAADGSIAVGDDTGIVFVLLPGGTFTMGAQSADPTAPNHDERAVPEEGPPHQVTLAPFFLARHELTQGQWHRLGSGENPSFYRAGTRQGMTWANPVEQVTWEQCAELMRHHGLELPTEAQWEYAARGGTTTPLWTKGDARSLSGVENVADRAAKLAGEDWITLRDEPEVEDGFVFHAPVHALQPNPFGLHHALGNVFEWCRDFKGGYDLTVAPADGLRQAASATHRVTRGGAFWSRSQDVRVTSRAAEAPSSQYRTLGVRAARRVLP
jgi:formylglycine-generating enzyme required for sulfatase activity